MKKLLRGTLKVINRAYESLIPDEETARRIGERYMSSYMVLYKR